jgi:diguanylate cyclase (GGDEF)-like protein
MLMDLDRFKEVNDTLGHHSGDKLLQQVALRLSGTVREIDTIARLGGDEFAVLLPDTDVQGAREAAARIHSAFEEIFVVDDLALDLSASVGIAVHPEHSDSSAGLLQRADVAMYVAKENKSGLEIYEPDRDQNSPARLSLAGDLRRAIDEGELVLHYQPKVDAVTRRVVGLEALVRWQHPEHGLVPPAEFIGLAEKTGLIKPLTMTVLDMALAQTVDWIEEGIRLPVAVNLSPLSLIDRSLPDEVSAALRRWGVPAELLELEVTESSLMHDPQRASEILSDVSAMGVTIAIDDFGTGYSSLGWLRQLPIDELKIDRSFVSAMTSSHEGMVIVESTVQLASNLDIRVVAEGVEDEVVAKVLAGLGCDMFQGFLMTRPLPADELSAWLARQRPRRRPPKKDVQPMAAAAV